MSPVLGPLTPTDIAFEHEKTKRVNKWVQQTHNHQHISPNSPPTPPISILNSQPTTKLGPSTMNNVYPGSVVPVPMVDPRSAGYSNVVYPTTPYPYPAMLPMSAPIQQQYNPMSTPYSPNGYPLPGGANQNGYGQQPGNMGMQVNNSTGFRERGSRSRNPSPSGYDREEDYGQQQNPNFLGSAPGGMQNVYGHSPSMIPQSYGAQPPPIVIMNHPSRSGGGGGRSRSRHHHSRSRPHTRSHSRARSRPYSRSPSPEQNYDERHDRDRDRGYDDEIGIPRDYVPASPGPDRRLWGSRARPGTGGGEGASGMEGRVPQRMHNPLGNHPGAEAAAAAVAGYALGHHEEKKHGHGDRHGHHNDHNYGQDLTSAFQNLTTGRGGGGSHTQNQERHRATSQSYPYGQGGGGYASTSRPMFSRHRSRSIDDRDLQTSRSRARYGGGGGGGGYPNQGAGGGGYQYQPQQPQMYNGLPQNPYQQQQQQMPYQQGGMTQGQGGPNVIHQSSTKATVVPIHDGKGGYMIVPPKGKEVRVVNTSNMYNNNANTRRGFRSRSQPRTAGAQPSFFSRLFGRNGQSSGPRVVQPQPANVQYLQAPRRGYGHHSTHTKKRRDSY